MLKKIVLFLLVSFIFYSCASKKDIYYFQDIDTNPQNQVNYLSSTIQINDILFIKISALIPETAEPFNIDASTATSSQGVSVENMKLQGYLVSKEGTIVFPILGTVNVVGKTMIEAQNLLKKLLSEGGYIKDPIVSVRVINNKVTILGEVNNPGTYEFSEQNLSLTQAIGLAGDLTINGKRKDVLLIREFNGTRNYVNLDLTSTVWFNSPYYYVKQNDVIIINPNGAKVISAGYLKDPGVIIGALSFLITLALFIKS